MLDNDIKNEVAGVLNLLPVISVCLDHPRPGVRYAACQCVRALSRSIRVLRTSLLDSGVGISLCEVVEKKDEDRRVTNTALAGLCNLLNDFSPLRQVRLFLLPVFWNEISALQDDLTLLPNFIFIDYTGPWDGREDF